MIEVDCSELTMDEQLALAAALTEAMKGSGVALIKGDRIVIDSLGGPAVGDSVVVEAVSAFVERRRDAGDYRVERQGDVLAVRSPDPIAAGHSRRPRGLPPNLMKCPFCSFVTPYEEEYVVHYRSHGAGA